MENDIYLFSRPVRTGKTTELLDWIKDKNAGGFLTPDVGGFRKLLEISSGEYHDFELLQDAEEESVNIGKFVFSRTIFEKAKAIISVSVNKDWLIVDEAGKLEIGQDKGLEPELSGTILKFKSGAPGERLLIVIRDTLLEKAIDKYSLRGANIIHSLKEIC